MRCLTLKKLSVPFLLVAFQKVIFGSLHRIRQDIQGLLKRGENEREPRNERLTIYYRISDASRPKVKLPNATKKHCLENCLGEFLDRTSEFNIIADNVKDETWDWLLELAKRSEKIKPERANYGDQWRTFKRAIERALEELPGGSPVYFVEDDYLHRKGSCDVLMQGLGIADYVTLYDHPDHYLNPDGPDEKSGFFVREKRVVLTKTCHWRFAHSTTGTFATTTDVLRHDRRICYRIASRELYSDYHAFRRLRKRKKRTIANPIPGYSTHAELEFLSPFVNWKEI